MPENPTDGETGKQNPHKRANLLNQDQIQWIDWERADRDRFDWDQGQWITRNGKQCSTRTKSKGSRGDGANDRLDPDQNQWITGRTDRRCKLNQDQVQWINWEHTADRSKAEQRGRTVGIQKSYAPPASKDAADGASLPLRLRTNT